MTVFPNVSVEVAFESPPAERVIAAVFTMGGDGAAGNSYRYVNLTAPADYTIQAGDFFEYEVYWPKYGGRPQRIVADATAAGVYNIRDDGNNDQNGLSPHPNTDLSAFANDGWYVRRILIGDGTGTGNTLDSYLIACEADAAGTYTAFLRRIRVVAGDGTTRRYLFWSGHQEDITHVLDINAGTNSHTLAVRPFGNASVKWTDISSYVRGISTVKGRQRELNRFEASEALVTVDNRRRHFDPSYPAGPFFGGLEPMRRIRIRAWDEDTYDLATLKLAPQGYWRLGDSTGSVVAEDSSGNERDLSIAGSAGFVNFGRPGSITDDEDTSVQFIGGTNVQYLRSAPDVLNITGTFLSFAFWLKYLVADASNDGVLYHGDLANTQGSYHFHVEGSTAFVRLDQGGLELTWTNAINGDGNWHHYAVTYDGSNVRLYVDGIQRTSAAYSGSIAGVSGGRLVLGRYHNTANNELSNGYLDEVAVWDVALTGAAVSLLYASAANRRWPLLTGYVQGWPQKRIGYGQAEVTIKCSDNFLPLKLAKITASHPQEPSDERIHRLLDAVSIPPEDRKVNVGQTTVAAASLVRADGLGHLQDVVEAEAGRAFVAGAGKVVFHDRAAPLNAPYTVSQGNFHDGSVGTSPTYLPYKDIEWDYDETEIYNEIVFSRQGGSEQIATDADSAERFWPRTLERTNLINASDPEVLDAANFTLSVYKIPKIRVRSLLLEGIGDPNLWPHILGREIGDKVSVFGTPQGIPPVIAHEVYIEGIEHEIYRNQDEGRVWRTTWRLAPAIGDQFWVLGVSQLGISTRLFF